MKKYFKKTLLIVLLVIMAIIASLNSFRLSATTYSSENTYELKVNVHDPYSLDDIIDLIGLTASKNGEDISDTIVGVNSNGYVNDVLNKPLASLRRLGTYKITFQAVDSRGIVTNASVNVVVVDEMPPIVLDKYSEGSVYISFNEIQKFGIDVVKTRILDNLRCFDAYDLFDLTYVVDTSCVKAKNGTYQVPITVLDKSSNSLDYSMQVVVYDEPSIRFEMSYEYYLATPEDNMTATKIINDAKIKAYDAEGNLLPVRLKNENNPGPYITDGIYLIEFEAGDNQKSASFNFYLEVIDTSNAVFELNESVLVVSSKELNAKDKIEELIRMKYHNEEFSYEITKDEYSDASEVEGDHNIDVHIYFDDHEEDMRFVMRVVKEEKVEEEQEKNPNFFEKAWNFIKKCTIIVLGILKWPFTFFTK